MTYSDRVKAHFNAPKSSQDYLAYCLSTVTVDLALPGDEGPKWGHIGIDSCDTLARVALQWAMEHWEPERG